MYKLYNNIINWINLQNMVNESDFDLILQQSISFYVVLKDLFMDILIETSYHFVFFFKMCMGTG